MTDDRLDLRLTSHVPSMPHRLLLAALMLVPVAGAAAQPQRDAYASGTAALEAGRTDEAYALFTAAAEAARAARDGAVEVRARRVLAQMEYNRGGRLAWTRDPEAALPHFEAGIGLDPDYARNYVGRGLALDALGQREQALVSLRQGIAAAERRSDIALRDWAEESLRRLIYDRIQPFTAAAVPTTTSAQIIIAELDVLDEFLPPDALGARYRAEALYTLGRYTEAIDVAGAALRTYRGERARAAGLHFVRGEAYLVIGDRQAAWEAYQGALYVPYRERAEARLRALR